MCLRKTVMGSRGDSVLFPKRGIPGATTGEEGRATRCPRHRPRSSRTRRLACGSRAPMGDPPRIKERTLRASACYLQPLVKARERPAGPATLQGTCRGGAGRRRAPREPGIRGRWCARPGGEGR